MGSMVVLQETNPLGESNSTLTESKTSVLAQTELQASYDSFFFDNL